MGKYMLRVEVDEDPENPREWDNIGIMVCFHGRYTLGDDGHGLRSRDFDGWDDLRRYLEEERGAVECLPLILLDHSGLAMSTTRQWPFSCPWDSGQVGWIYTTAERLDTMGAGDGFDVTAALEAEVATYDKYLRGEVYGYVITNEAGSVVDSCWGFFGEDEAFEEGKAALDAIEHEDEQERRRNVAKWSACGPKHAVE